MLVKRILNPKITKESKSENLLWVEIGLEPKLFVATTHLVPNDSDRYNDQTLAELQRDILELDKKGRIIVLGDSMLEWESYLTGFPTHSVMERN